MPRGGRFSAAGRTPFSRRFRVFGEFFQNNHSRFLGDFEGSARRGVGGWPFSSEKTRFFGPSFSRWGTIVPRGIFLRFPPVSRAVFGSGHGSLVFGRLRRAAAKTHDPSPKTDDRFPQHFSKSARFAPVVGGRWSVDSGKWSVESGQWKVVGGKWSVESGRWTGNRGQGTIGRGRLGNDERSFFGAVFRFCHVGLSRRPYPPTSASGDCLGSLGLILTRDRAEARPRPKTQDNTIHPYMFPRYDQISGRGGFLQRNS